MNPHDSATTKPAGPPMPEPWLRGTIPEVSAVPRAVLHALQLAAEDLHKWCSVLSDLELNARPSNLPCVAFHLRHIARSLDRLLSYAEGQALSPAQLAAMRDEGQAYAKRQPLFTELNSALIRSAERLRELAHADLEETRTVGKKSLPTTVGGLLVHIADHTQRHVGQAITTAKLITAQRR
jgi:uncharacterized damage-inducible protein DinB